MINNISTEAFCTLYRQSDEFAVIDPREELFFSRAHLFAATNMPLSHLEMLIDAAVPLKDTMIVLCDDADGLAERAAGVLVALGYSDLRVLTGGLPMWAHLGGTVYPDIHVPSKALGEAVEHQLGTPKISVERFLEKTSAGKKMILLDARPMDEHTDHCIPGSISCPTAELIYRTAELPIDEGTQVVVHCAGRTRSIVGAQTLIDSGVIPNAVSLENGTPAWLFAGQELETGDGRTLPEPGAEGLKAARQVAERLRVEWKIPLLRSEEIGEWQNLPGTRYVLDIRSEEEYLAGHVRDSRHIAGGQLIQTTECHLVVQNAHILLIDDDGVRAATTAVWLRRMGWQNVVVCKITPEKPGLDAGHLPALCFDDVALISIDETAISLQAGSAVLCDIRSSVDYRRGHVAGAGYLSRARIDQDASQLPVGKDIILMADDQAYAELISRDLKRLGHTVYQLDADLNAWIAADQPIATGLNWLISSPIDTYLLAADFDDQTVANRISRAYESWVVTLNDATKGEPGMRFDIR